MRAVRLDQWGEPVHVEELERPEPGSDEVLVHVRAASVNPVDRAIASGYLAGYANVPMTMGTDFAGEVVAVGEDVSHVQPGDEVFGIVVMRGGTFADYLLVKGDEVALKPESLDFVSAGAVPLAGLTAWQTLFELAQIQPDERVLIHGAGGSVGSFAIQLAKEAGAYVIASVLADRADFVKELGADEVILSDLVEFEDVASDVDVVIDLVGGNMVERSLNVCGPGARCYSAAAFIGPDLGEPHGILTSGVAAHPSVENLTQLAERFDDGRLVVHVDQTFPLEETQQAMMYSSLTSKPTKVVIII